jgi:PAS domain S-box-containing protein
MEEAIMETERRFQNVVELTNDWVWEIDENLKFTHVTIRVTDLLGYTPEEALGKTPFDFMTPDEAKWVEAIIKPIMEARQNYTFMESRYIHKDGHEVIFETSGNPIYDNVNRFIGYRGIVRDITSRKHAEEKLKKREDELREKTIRLEEVNNALKTLLKHRDENKKELENKILSNINELVLPYIAKLKETHLDAYQQVYVEIMETNLNDVLSPFLLKITSKYLSFTPKEIQVATLIKEGKPTKEIAKMMKVGKGAVDLHRHHIRNKLGLNNKKVNLRSYLSSLS